MLKNLTLKQPSAYNWLLVAIIICFTGIFQTAQAQDMGVTSLISPVSPVCAAINQTVVVSIKNDDAATIDYSLDTVIVTVDISGASTQIFTDTLYSGTLAADSSQTITVTALCDLSVTGIHTFKVYTTILSGDLNALNDTLAPVNITVDPSPATPVITAYGPVSFCEGDSVLLVSSSATDNVWTGGTTDDSLTVLVSGPFTVTVTSGGCSSTSAVTTVTANPFPATPVITAYDTISICQGDSVTLVSSSATGNLWIGGATDDSITVYTSGPYAVTVTIAGCSATSDTTTVAVNPFPPVPTITTSDSVVFCEGGSVILYSSSASGNTWTGGSTADSAIVSTAGDYSVTVTVNGCSSTSADTTVSLLPLPTVSLAAFTVTPCSNAAPFALTGGLPAGGTFSGIGVNAGMFYPGSAGAVQGITYTYTDANGCSNSATSNITVVFCTGIEEITSNGIAVYPNPSANGIFNISSKNANFSELLISIVDIQGKEVFNALDLNISAEYNKQINIMHLAKGMYYLKMSTDSEMKIKKLIIE